MAIDTDRVERAVRELLIGIGEDPTREGLRDTPKRVAQMYEEIAGGKDEDAIRVLSTQFAEDHQEMVIMRDVPFYSMCEHHLLPFFGTAHVGYMPRGKVVGISKLARAVDIFARRPQVQERLTSQVADAIMEALEPDGVAVVAARNSSRWTFLHTRRMMQPYPMARWCWSVPAPPRTSARS